MNRLLSIARTAAPLLLALLAADSRAQTWVSRTSPADSGVINTSGASAAEGPSLGNTQSQWTPRFQPPRTRVKATGHVEPFVEDEVEQGAALSPAEPVRTARLPMVDHERPPQQRQRVVKASAQKSPAWQHLPRVADSAPPRPAQFSHFAGPPRRMAQAQPLPPRNPAQVGNSPFVEDELVPQGQRTPAADGEIEFENGQALDGIADGTVADGDGACPEGDGCIDGCCDGCFDPCCDGWYDPMQFERWYVCSPLSFLNELSFNTGVLAFKSPVDNGRNANFGGLSGVNLGDAIWHHYGIGYQLGANFIESNSYGDQANPLVGFEPGSRRQVFATAGLFHRAFYNWGWQGGAVVDYLNDKYYYDATLVQIRAELSYVFYGGNEIGSWIAAHARNAPLVIGTRQLGTLQPINLYTLFFRHTMYNGTQARFWAGFTDPIPNAIFPGNNNASAIVGADFRVVLSNKWDFTGVVNYLPSTQGTPAGQPIESWAVGMNVVYYPFRWANGRHNGPYRPLFNVADNSTFIVARRP